MSYRMSSMPTSRQTANVKMFLKTRCLLCLNSGYSCDWTTATTTVNDTEIMAISFYKDE